jgi:hypothetical protein
MILTAAAAGLQPKYPDLGETPAGDGAGLIIVNRILSSS